ncbi:MAG: 50S ribosomal protein L1 [Candidatus Micrarchaeota archaeon]|nr:50S ribosomal protein L1 [Candidatus Micrarchaeota archaeon]
MIEKKKIEQTVHACLEDKGKRKFTQSVDLAVNFTGVDFKKAENRLGLDVVLPYAGRNKRVAVFADGQLAMDAKKHADLVISGAEIPAYASDKKKQGELLGYALLASPQLMPVVGKQLGQVLGGRGKLPKPIMPGADLAGLVNSIKRTVTVRSRGKFLPSVHCPVGTETMKEEELVENISAVLEAVEKKISEHNFYSVYVKTTMGKPARLL